jgi:hypothetical protein
MRLRRMFVLTPRTNRSGAPSPHRTASPRHAKRLWITTVLEPQNVSAESVVKRAPKWAFQRVPKYQFWNHPDEGVQRVRAGS